MKTLITTLNAKFIHTALSLRLLYVASKDHHDVDFKEYTIKDDLHHIKEDLLSMNLDVVAFSCYIWNIAYIEKLCAMLKEEKPELIIMLGGPEVTYEPAHFLETFQIDYVMSGEGEETFPQLLSCLEEKRPVDVCGVSYRGHISKEVACVDLKLVESLDSPYDLVQDRKDKAKRILYFETSRGCPFQCQYCLSSLENGLRFFSRDYLEKQLDIVIHSGAKVVKLLDRSFNASVDHALFILDYLFKHYVPGQQFQFEINADVFQQKILDFINENAPEGLLRFEVGIQSTYEPTNRAVKRMQNFERLSEVVKALMAGGKCDLHLDLIAGLPYESYTRFQQSFDEVFAFRAKELQLGFLKMLRGTSLRNNADDFGYSYDEAPPYEMQENHWMNESDIENIHIAEDMLEKYWNSGRFSLSMNAIMDAEASAFDFFYRLGCYYDAHHYPRIGYQLFELFDCLNAFTNGQYEELLIRDYLPLYKTRPKKWYHQTLNRQQRHQVIVYLSNRYGLNPDQLHRYAIIEELKDGYLVAVYENLQCHLKIYKKEGDIDE